MSTDNNAIDNKKGKIGFFTFFIYSAWLLTSISLCLFVIVLVLKAIFAFIQFIW